MTHRPRSGVNRLCEEGGRSRQIWASRQAPSPGGRRARTARCAPALRPVHCFAARARRRGYSTGEHSRDAVKTWSASHRAPSSHCAEAYSCRPQCMSRHVPWRQGSTRRQLHTVCCGSCLMLLCAAQRRWPSWSTGVGKPCGGACDMETHSSKWWQGRPALRQAALHHTDPNLARFPSPPQLNPPCLAPALPPAAKPPCAVTTAAATACPPGSSPGCGHGWTRVASPTARCFAWTTTRSAALPTAVATGASHALRWWQAREGVETGRAHARGVGHTCVC